MTTPDDMPAFTPGARVLFQGDSITDGNRGRSADPNHILGHGYCFLIAARFGAAFPDRRLTFLNRGVSGQTVLDLQRRWAQDTLAIQPDLLSILVGVNDSHQDVPLETYERTYDSLLADCRAANPRVRFVLCEPFYLPAGGGNVVSLRVEDVRFRGLIVERLAARYNAAFVRFQPMFEAACALAPPDYWVWDCVHPTYSGHQLMAQEWVRTVGDFYR